ncbi:MAG: tetratricopeptide repeat protein [Candidatus Thiodiazotropha sp.]
MRGLQAYQRENLMVAIELLQRAADNGHAKAQSMLGYIFDKAEENEQAFHYYQLAADQGDADGAYGLGNLYAAGEGVEKNLSQAVGWYEKAAYNDHLLAIDVLATAYLNGGLALTKNTSKAIDLLQRGAALGHLPSVRRLRKIRENEGI